MASDGRSQCLKGAHSGFVGFLAKQSSVAEKNAGGKLELAYLNEAQFDAVEDARAAKQRDQTENAPKDAVDVTHKVI